MKNNIWRHSSRAYVNHRGEQVVAEDLVGPGYAAEVVDCVYREAIPQKTEGSFRVHSNGWGTLQIMNEKRKFLAIEFGKDSGNTAEEALYMALKIVEALNAK